MYSTLSQKSLSKQFYSSLVSVAIVVGTNHPHFSTSVNSIVFCISDIQEFFMKFIP